MQSHFTAHSASDFKPPRNARKFALRKQTKSFANQDTPSEGSSGKRKRTDEKRPKSAEMTARYRTADDSARSVSLSESRYPAVFVYHHKRNTSVTLNK